MDEKEAGPGWKQDRQESDSSGGLTYNFNPNKSLSIQEQRRRLPVYQYKTDILYQLEHYQTLVIQGETGSGKSTQIPQYLMEHGWTRASASSVKMVGITQPRKVAACSLAARVAEEVDCDLGDVVGYNVRFDDKWTLGKTHIKFMTEGILIREMMSDPLLEKYSVIILDEAHERTVNTDILMGLLKRILIKKPDLKLIVSSATLEAETLMKFFDFKKKRSSRSNYQDGEKSRHSSTILCIEGRNHPIDIMYIKNPVPDYIKGCVDAVIAVHESERSGDVLVFLTGQDEVEEAVSKLLDYSKSLSSRSTDLKKMYVLPLHGSLPSRDQFKVFETFPRSVRKVIVSTNISEASVTIPGITYVIDSGFVKMKIFNPVTTSDSLVVVPISQASARQRAGRAGRTSAGKVFRLYREEDFKTLPEFTVPELQRTSMASVIIQLKALGVSNICDFDFPARPPEVNLLSGLELLYALEALDEEGELTDLGMKMAEFPLEPTLSKMLLESEKFECCEEILTIVSMMQVENIFQSPGGSGQRSIQARNAKYRFAVEEGDLISYLNIYNEFTSNGRIRSWSDKNFLNYNALLRVCEIRSRLLTTLTSRFKMKLVTADGDIECVLKCIVSGLFSNAAFLDPREGERVYKTVRGDHKLFIHPSSVLNTVRHPPKWVIFNEVLHTSQDFMRDLVSIDPKWLYEVAPKYFEYGTERELREKRTITL
jgi:ATP-dependent RNA helicase DDX35